MQLMPAEIAVSGGVLTDDVTASKKSSVLISGNNTVAIATGGFVIHHYLKVKPAVRVQHGKPVKLNISEVDLLIQNKGLSCISRQKYHLLFFSCHIKSDIHTLILINMQITGSSVMLLLGFRGGLISFSSSCF